MFEFARPPLDHRGLLKQLRQIRDALVTAGGTLIVGVCGGGTHPFQQRSDRKIFAKLRFKKVPTLYGSLVKQFTLFGQHVQVGCRSGDEAMYLLYALNRYVLHFIALAASSPCVQRNDTPCNSARLNSVFAFPPSGRAPFMLSWQAFETQFFALIKRIGLAEGMVAAAIDRFRESPDTGTVS